MGQPRPLYNLFSVFSKKNNTIFTKNQCKKMSCPFSIRRRDLNPQPLKHELSPITTRPGLPPLNILVCQMSFKSFSVGQSTIGTLLWPTWQTAKEVFKGLTHFRIWSFQDQGENETERKKWGAAIAQWICLCLPSCHPGFKTQAHHLCFFHLQFCAIFVMWK